MGGSSMGVGTGVVDCPFSSGVGKFVTSVFFFSLCFTDAGVYIAPSDNTPITEDKTGPYLCTGLDIYISHEPCTMLAEICIILKLKYIIILCISGS